MNFAICFLAGCLTLADASAENRGVIAGVVVNASQGKSPAGGSKVVLRVKLEGQFTPFGETTADEQGRFLFTHLPVGKYYEYLPGANRDGVHYPGPQVQLTPEQPRVLVEVRVCDAISAPNPLILRRHDILLRSEPGVLHVTESLTVDNPSSTCYIGQSPRKGEEPVTFQLSIPPEFEKATFDEEYFGRRFAVADGKLITSVPWPPGKKEVKFTYVLRNTQTSRTWERSLDLPCSNVCIRVRAAKPDEVVCNLPRGLVKNVEREAAEVLFQSGKSLPAGYMLRVDLEHLPIPWMAFARWLAVAFLIGTAAGVSFVAIRRRRADSSSTPATRKVK